MEVDFMEGLNSGFKFNKFEGLRRDQHGDAMDVVSKLSTGKYCSAYVGSVFGGDLTIGFEKSRDRDVIVALINVMALGGAGSQQFLKSDGTWPVPGGGIG